MAEERNFNKLLQLKTSDLRRKNKRNKGSATDPKLKEKPGSAPPKPQLPPEDQLPKLRATGKKARDHRLLKTKDQHYDSKSLDPADYTSSDSKDVCAQARDSLRWEGVLQDPQEEAKRLERYRASRRQRYIAHREALLQEALHASEQTDLKT